MAVHETLVAGGGLAGGAFAVQIARRGLPVTVLERSSRPRLKVCGDFLSVEAQQLLRMLGIDVFEHGAREISTLRLMAGRREAHAPLPFVAAGVTRLKLDELLLARAAEEGAEIVRGVTVTGMRAVAGGILVHTGDAARRAANAALATGKHNVKGWPRRRDGPTGYKMTFRLTQAASRSLAGAVQLVSYRGGYGGACCVEDGAATVCWLADAQMMKRIGSGWRDHIAHICGECPAFAGFLTSAEALFDKPATVSAIPYGYRRRTVIADTVFPVGDQICVIPSFTGDGTSLALSSGMAAANAVLEGQGAGAYQKAFLAGLGAQFAVARLTEALFQTPALQQLAVAGVSLFPSAATGIARLTRARTVLRRLEFQHHEIG